MNKYTVPDTYKITFGKYEGEMIGNVPADYLLWAYRTLRYLDRPFWLYVDQNLKDLEAEVANHQKEKQYAKTN